MRGRDAALDAGANIGVWSILGAAEMAPRGRIVAVEPAPATFEVLTDSARVLRAPGRIIPVHGALSDHAGTGFLRVESPLACTNHLTNNGPDGAVESRLFTIDTLLAEHELRPAAIKVDVEGAELDVLRGAKATLRDTRPVIVLELHWWAGVDPITLLDLANDARYAVCAGDGGVMTRPDALLAHNFVLMRPLPN